MHGDGAAVRGARGVRQGVLRKRFCTGTDWIIAVVFDLLNLADPLVIRPIAAIDDFP